MSDPYQEGPAARLGTNHADARGDRARRVRAHRRSLLGAVRHCLILAPACGMLALAPTASARLTVSDRAPGGCKLTRITGIVEDRTALKMTLIHASHGRTNTWCQRPAAHVKPHSLGQTWRAGDYAGGAVHLTYKLSNGDEVRFDALVHYPGGGSEIDCSFVRIARSSRDYECKAQVSVARVWRDQKVGFVVQPTVLGPGLGARTTPPGQRVAARPAYCGATSTIDGTTVNNSGTRINNSNFAWGVTNEICSDTPRDHLAPGERDHWSIGDNVFGASIVGTYLIQTGNVIIDEFNFNGSVNFGSGGGSATCGTPEPYNPSGRYTCKATWSQNGFDEHRALVTWEVDNAPGPPARLTGQGVRSRNRGSELPTI